MRRRSSIELWWALATVIVITALHQIIAYTSGQTPPASGLAGHLIGVMGFFLMLMTEFLYSIRKRYRRAALWGRADTWLRFHIYTGIVGPYMVLLHSAWEFRGLAGVVMLLTVIITGSGFIGRYVYTMVPRTVEGNDAGGEYLEPYLMANTAELQRAVAGNLVLEEAVKRELADISRQSGNLWLVFLGRPFIDRGFHRRWRKHTRAVPVAEGRQIEKLIDTRRELQFQASSLVTVRRILSLWHTIHIPLGIILFITAFVHIGAAMYYVTLAR